MSSTTIDLNFNASECIQKTYDLTSFTVTNICNGDSQQVPFGLIDLIAYYGLTAMQKYQKMHIMNSIPTA